MLRSLSQLRRLKLAGSRARGVGGGEEVAALLGGMAALRVLALGSLCLSISSKLLRIVGEACLPLRRRVQPFALLAAGASQAVVSAPAVAADLAGDAALVLQAEVRPTATRGSLRI